MFEVWEMAWSDFRGVMDPYIRYIALTLLVLVISAITATLIIRRNKATRRVRRVMMWIFLFLVVCCYGIADNIDDEIRVSAAIYLSAFCFGGMLLSMIWHPKGDDKTPPEDNSIGTRFAHWLDHKVREHKSRKPSHAPSA